MTDIKIVRIDRRAALQPCVTVEPENLISGPPEEAIRIFHETHRGAFTCGIWSSTPAKDRITDFPVDELCIILEGEIELVSESSHSERFSEGDAFVVPKGFKGTWETVRPVRKLFAIYDISKRELAS